MVYAIWRHAITHIGMWSFGPLESKRDNDISSLFPQELYMTLVSLTQ